MPWTTKQKLFIVEAYFRQKSIHAAQLQFIERFGCCELPVQSIIYRWVNKFRTRGTVYNLNRKCTNRQSHSGRLKSSRTPHNVAVVRDSVVHSPRDDNERSVTFNTDRYVQVLGKFWTALGRRRGVVRVLQWFQQDGAYPPLLKRIIGMATAAFP